MKTVFVLALAILLRLALIYLGYTDIDYLVFTDASRLLSRGHSPYDRATYRYTPLLAWLLYPTTWKGFWFEYGKVLFAASDVLTGWLMIRILRRRTKRATEYACIWLLNPMVASISARGSSEGLVALLTIALLWATVQKRVAIAGLLLGFAVHFKIYPFIYATSIFWCLGSTAPQTKEDSQDGKDDMPWTTQLTTFLSPARITLIATSALSFMACNVLMFSYYGMPFVEHTFLYHFTRIDHRHNFSVYNTMLHINSAYSGHSGDLQIGSLAFIPQLLLSVVVIPIVLAKKNLPGAMLAQTFAFVTFNKVCTSQYFLWYMVFLPLYLPNSTVLWGENGILILLLWVVGQAAWLQQGYELEFIGNSTFVPGLWVSSIVFFLINCLILKLIVDDVGKSANATQAKKTT